MTIEDRLRELAADVRVEVGGDVATRVETRARARAVRHRAAFATAAVAVGGATAAVAAGRSGAAPDSGLVAPSPTASPSVSPSPSPSRTGPQPVLDAAREKAVVARCDAFLRDMTNGRESFPDGSYVAAFATDAVGDTALVVSGTRYRACHLLGGQADDVDPEWSNAACASADVSPGKWGWGPTGVANGQAGKEPGSGTDPDGPIRHFWLLHGCVSARVARVEVRTNQGVFDAVVVNGMFVGRRDTGVSVMPGEKVDPEEALDPYPGFGYRAYDASGRLVERWPEPADPRVLGEQYLACARGKGFDPQFAQVFLGADGKVEHVKTAYEVPAEVHRPCFVAIGGADPHTSNYGDPG